MSKCIQSAGRCIRSETDRGAVIYLDERFAWGNYRKVFPGDMNIKITTEPEELIKDFWKNSKTWNDFLNL